MFGMKNPSLKTFVDYGAVAKETPTEADLNYVLRTPKGNSLLGVIVRQDIDIDTDTLLLVHTYTDKAARGAGRAHWLLKQALEDIRAQGKKVIPVCPFVMWFMGETTNYDDILSVTVRRSSMPGEGQASTEDVLAAHRTLH